jgi:hypothetical protein
MAADKRPLDEGDWNMAYLFPDEVAEARAHRARPPASGAHRVARPADTDAATGARYVEEAAREVLAEIRATLLASR